MELTATALAKLIEGTIEGDGTVLLNQVAKIEEGTPGCLTFLANPEIRNFYLRDRRKRSTRGDGFRCPQAPA